MELKEVESATCSSRTLITGFNFHFCSDLVTVGIISLPKVFIQTQINQQYHLLSLPARATLTAVWEVKEWAGSMPWSAATTTRLPFNVTWTRWLFNLCTQQLLFSRVTLLSHRAPTSRQRLRSTSRSLDKDLNTNFTILNKNPLKNFIAVLKRNPNTNSTVLSKDWNPLTVCRSPTEEPLAFPLGGWEAMTCTRRALGAGPGGSWDLFSGDYLICVSSGQPFGYTNWIEGEPNDSNGLEDCIAIDRCLKIPFLFSLGRF